MLRPIGPPIPPHKVREVPCLVGDAYVGLDLSLTSTAVGRLRQGHAGFSTLKPKLKGAQRLVELDRKLAVCLPRHENVRLVAVEGYSFGSVSRQHRIGEWGGVVRLRLVQQKRRFIEVPPKTLKMFVAGNGSADKVDMLAAIREIYGVPVTNDDEADAVGLAIFAAAFENETAFSLSTKQVDALEKFRKTLATGCKGLTKKPRPSR